ncbi:cytochrome P450 [Melanogaster broomeanus]|nr:cytochrome P450 [Melanogaster broomeanus]
MIPGVILCLAILTLILAWHRRRLVVRHSVRDIRGPPSPSLLLGHEKVVRHAEQIGDLEFQWVREYGPTWRTKQCYGADALWTADPRTLHYIFHASSYKFSRTVISDEVARLLTGQGILTTSPHDHQRHKKIMTPAFSVAHLRTFLPVFLRSASRLSQKWKDLLQADPSSNLFDVNKMLARMTLDIIGEVAFDHQFGALDNKEHELVKAFDNVFSDSLLHPPSWDVLFKAAWKYFPSSWLHLLRYLPTKEYKRFSHYLETARRTGKALISDKASGTEKDGKDILSVLVQSNLTEDARYRLSEQEMLSQIATLLVAGHDSTASSLTWTLYELSRHPEDQQRVRDEIREAKAKARAEARGDDDLIPSDYDAMAFTNAIIKESLRLHPVSPTLYRVADYDDVLPLSIPIETNHGKCIKEIPIAKGQTILVSICTYNRLKSVWGEDADTWNPTRFLDNSKERLTLGVFANLSAGVRACIAWRFALLEMQAVLTELVEHLVFEFPEGVDIIRLNAGNMVPMVRGKMEEGVQMPLRISVIN